MRYRSAVPPLILILAATAGTLACDTQARRQRRAEEARRNQEWEDAVKGFDVLLKAHPDSKRAPAALYYKADALAKLGRATEASDTLKELRKRFPDNPLARQSQTIKP